MKISELEEHHDQFLALQSTISDALAAQAFSRVFDTCRESLDHIVPALRYRKRRQITPETPDILSFTVAFEYGAPLFEHSLLKDLLDFIQSTRLLAKHDNEYAQSAEAALEQFTFIRS